MQILWTLYRAFFMIGALTFGGGSAVRLFICDRNRYF